MDHFQTWDFSCTWWKARRGDFLQQKTEPTVGDTTVRTFARISLHQPSDSLFLGYQMREKISVGGTSPSLEKLIFFMAQIRPIVQSLPVPTRENFAICWTSLLSCSACPALLNYIYIKRYKSGHILDKYVPHEINLGLFHGFKKFIDVMLCQN